MRILFTLLLLLSCYCAFGYVENVTKGYPNCMACHISPNGGGILTDYGRSLSRDMMSTWSGPESFANPFYGLVKNTKNIKYGGQFRTLQLHSENDKIEVKKEFVMQNNVEFAAKYMNSFLVGTLGRKEGPNETKDRGEFLSERHYVLWNASDEIRVRAGKFRQHFGINHANHTRFVKASLGFGSNSESYNLEVSKYYDWGELNASTSIGKLFEDEDKDQGQRNFVFNYTHYLEGNSRVGVSTLIGKSEQYKRSIVGANGVFPIGKNGVGRSEVNFEKKNLIDNSRVQGEISALYGDHLYGYKFFKGGLGYLLFEHSQKNLDDHETLITAPGFGFQFLPISHVELQFEYQRRSYESDVGNVEHRSFFTFHLYH